MAQVVLAVLAHWQRQQDQTNAKYGTRTRNSESLPDPYRRFNRNLKKRLGGLQTSPLLDLRFKIPRRDWGRDYTADNQHVVQRSALRLYCIVAYYRLIQLHLVIPSILCCPNQSINIHTCDCFRQPHLSSLDLSRS